MPPWQISGPQPALAEVAEAGLLRGRVLDVGCGTGEHALMAAALGFEAVGVDLSEEALEQARASARERELAVRFVRHDVLDLGSLGERFDVVLDSLVFHSFHGRERERYVEGLAAVLVPGGRLFVLCYAEEPPGASGRQHKVTPEELRESFADGWSIEAIDAVAVLTTLPSLPQGIRAWRASVLRSAEAG